MSYCTRGTIHLMPYRQYATAHVLKIHLILQDFRQAQQLLILVLHFVILSGRFGKAEGEDFLRSPSMGCSLRGSFQFSSITLLSSLKASLGFLRTRLRLYPAGFFSCIQEDLEDFSLPISSHCCLAPSRH